MIVLHEHTAGFILPVRAQPGARKTAVMGEQDGALKLAVNAPPAEGKANKALVELLRDLLDLKRSQIEMVSGDKGRDKRFLIRGLSRTELQERITRLLDYPARASAGHSRNTAEKDHRGQRMPSPLSTATSDPSATNAEPGG